MLKYIILSKLSSSPQNFRVSQFFISSFSTFLFYVYYFQCLMHTKFILVYRGEEILFYTLQYIYSTDHRSATVIMSKITENKKKILNVPKNLTKTQQSNKLSEDMENEIKDAFNFYDVDKKGLIARNNLRSILGNFAFSKMNGKEIQEQISYIYDNKDQFTLQETIQIITKKWFEGKGREAQAEQMFALFDRKQKGGVGLSEIKHVFNQYLDINISDADILQFIEEADNDKKGYLNKEEFFMKLGYN